MAAVPLMAMAAVPLLATTFMFRPVIASPANPSGLNEFRNILYVGDWTHYQQGMDPQKLPYGDITHLIYSFGNITEDTGEA